MAGYQGDGSVHTLALRALADKLDSGLFATEITPDITGSGHRAADLLTLTEQGDLEICYFAASYLGDRVAEIELLDLPFLITDRSTGYELFDGPLGADIYRKLVANSGYRILGWWDNGFRHLTSAKSAIRTPADCTGQKIRTMGSAPQHQRVLAAMGFTTEALDVRELMPAIATGSVDAQENPLTNIWNFKIHEYHRWITLTGHFFGPSLLLCNADFYNSLTDSERTELDRAATSATAIQREHAATEDALITMRLAETNNEIIRLTAPEFTAFREAVQPVVDSVLGRFPVETTAMLPPLTQ
jgi:C4-dicarboxylate-binding protein DctP